MNGAAPAIALRGAGKRFGTQQALVGIDLTVAPGTFVSVVGESGCGKTTLLRLIAGLEPATAGAVEVAGEPVTGPQAGIGFVFQSPVLLRWRTALENVLLPAHVAGRRIGPELRRRALTLLERAGIGAAGGKLPRELSGGMQSRVALARALLLEPAILLLDEPFAALDALTRERLALALLDLCADAGLTALFVTHDIGEAVFLADRVVLLAPDPGRLHREFAVPLPRPRTPAMRYEAEYIALCREVRLAMAEVESGATREDGSR